MRSAAAEELKTNALPVLTARVSNVELARWFPVSFYDLSHPQEVAEPSKAALIQLDAGDLFVLFWGQVSNQLMLRIGPDVDASQFLRELLREVPLPRTRIISLRSDARLPRHVAAKRVSLAAGKPADRTTRVRRSKPKS